MGRQGGPRVWADDAQATWFEPLAVADPNLVPDNLEACIRDFLIAGPLAVPGSYAADRDYGYGASSFLSYVHRFIDKTVATRWIAQRTPDREPWALLIPMIGGDSALAGRWRDFGERIFTKRLLPNTASPDPKTFMPLNDEQTFRFLSPNDTEDKKWLQSHDLSMHFYSMLLPNGIPTLTDTTVLGFQVLEKYPDVDLYVMGLKSGKFYSMQRGIGELTIDGKDLAAESGLLVAAVSYSYDPAPSVKARRDITVRMGLADPTVKVQGYIGGDRVIGATYNFTTQNRNIPANASYSWDFGNEKPASTRVAQASWTRAGTYKVKVEAKWPGRTVTDEMTPWLSPRTSLLQRRQTCCSMCIGR